MIGPRPERGRSSKTTAKHSVLRPSNCTKFLLEQTLLILRSLSLSNMPPPRWKKSKKVQLIRDARRIHRPDAKFGGVRQKPIRRSDRVRDRTGNSGLSQTKKMSAKHKEEPKARTKSKRGSAKSMDMTLFVGQEMCTFSAPQKPGPKPSRKSTRCELGHSHIASREPRLG